MKYNNGKPNVLWIQTDQMTPFLTGAYGHKVVKTPYLNNLVKEGVRFDNAYTTCPICAPARASILTGKYVSDIGCYDNAAPLPCDEPTVAHYLTNAGYDTVAIGKMHLIGPDQLHGFRKRLTTNIYPADFWWTPTRDEKKLEDLHAQPIAIDYVTAGKRLWSMGLDFDEETHLRALEYLRTKSPRRTGSLQVPQKEKDERPFFLLVSYQHPHEPFHVTEELWNLYEGEEIEIPEIPSDIHEKYSAHDRWLNKFHGVDKVTFNKENLYNLRRSYYGLVTYVDRKVGELLKVLEQCGFSDNTVVIFQSDHGEMLAEKGMVQKRCFYEYSSRIPLIMKFPKTWGNEYRGIKYKGLVSLIDILPTIMDICGVENYLPCEGEDLLALLKKSNTNNRVIFSEHHAEGTFAPCFMVRKGQYKYIYITGKNCQLFDLQLDPKENNNLSGKPEYRKIEEELKNDLLGRFSPEEIEKNVRKSIGKRQIIRSAMKTNDTHWDFQPFFDATKQYWRYV